MYIHCENRPKNPRVNSGSIVFYKVIVWMYNCAKNSTCSLKICYFLMKSYLGTIDPFVLSCHGNTFPFFFTSSQHFYVSWHFWPKFNYYMFGGWVIGNSFTFIMKIYHIYIHLSFYFLIWQLSVFDLSSLAILCEILHTIV